MDICIVTADSSLARFLLLELTEAGYTACIADTATAARLYLCDLDSFAGELPAQAIGISYEEGNKHRTKVFLPRPVHAEELLRAVAEVICPAALGTDTRRLTAERSTRHIHSNGSSVRLSEKELALLERLCTSNLLTRENAADIFGSGDSNVVDVYMHYLRRKLKTVCPYEVICAKRGAGYSLSADVTILFS